MAWQDDDEYNIDCSEDGIPIPAHGGIIHDTMALCDDTDSELNGGFVVRFIGTVEDVLRKHRCSHCNLAVRCRRRDIHKFI